MKKYIFIAITVLDFILFAICSGGRSRKCESNCFKTQTEQLIGNVKYKIVTYEDSVKMKRYTILVCTWDRGCGCTLIDTEKIK